LPPTPPAKSGLIGLTQALAAEFGRQGVRVNAILPGAVETDMYLAMNDTADKQTFMTNLHAAWASRRDRPHGPVSGLR
jgi:NAD(P)-dependent dehydrogenase (short-subunit alcohol dehydrogenase family)